MASIGIVLPTIASRWDQLDRTIGAYEATCPSGCEFDLNIVEGFDTVGKAWRVGVDELLEGSCEYLFLAIDDAEPHPGWAEVAVQTADAGYVPAPRMLHADGTLMSCGTMGFGVLLPEAEDCTPCRNTGLIFMRREWWDEVGAIGDQHYAIDDLWCWKAALHGHHVIYRSGMVFTHRHVEDAATQHIRDTAGQQIAECIAEMARVRHPDKTVRTLADDPALVLTHYPK